MLLSVIATILSLAASWLVYKKMGRQGWEGIVPLYNCYVLCEILYKNGWKFLFLIIPFYNIYFAIKLYIDWAKTFNKSAGFAIGMLFLPFIFNLILAFGNSHYGDGTAANTNPDFITQVVNKTKETAEKAVGAKSSTSDEHALEKLQLLSEMKNNGVISEEDFNEKKLELMKRI